MGSHKGLDGTRLARGVAIAVAVIVAVLIVFGFLMRDVVGRLGSVESKADKAATTAAGAAEQGATNAQLLKEIKGITSTVVANQEGIRATGEQAARAAAAAQAASEFLTACFKPGGPCARSAEKNQAFIRQQLAEVVTKVSQTEFVVKEIRGAPGKPSTFVATPVRPSCEPLIGVGNVGVGDGLLCKTP